MGEELPFCVSRCSDFDLNPRRKNIGVSADHHVRDLQEDEEALFISETLAICPVTRCAWRLIVCQATSPRPLASPFHPQNGMEARVASATTIHRRSIPIFFNQVQMCAIDTLPCGPPPPSPGALSPPHEVLKMCCRRSRLEGSNLRCRVAFLVPALVGWIGNAKNCLENRYARLQRDSITAK